MVKVVTFFLDIVFAWTPLSVTFTVTECWRPNEGLPAHGHDVRLVEYCRFRGQGEPGVMDGLARRQR